MNDSGAPDAHPADRRRGGRGPPAGADPAPAERARAAQTRVTAIARGAFAQYPGILLLAPTLEGRERSEGGWTYLRVKFRIWPGQGALLEQAIKPALVHAVRALDSSYADWMVSVHYRAEPRNPQRRLPRPAAVRKREKRRDPSPGS